ncbi:YraN family protein [Corynebacterium freneyi]|uniref:YraN family protein n=1 Tax=Corynebacterium freneyi TaxID=134034 RepID=UPI00254ACEB6|nr:YraN family protein [Corynebacterium freneyi]MDK8767162.1 YraN family protein [Corynebacterium freneyi]
MTRAGAGRQEQAERRRLGAAGEAAAVGFLEGRGLTLIGTNVRVGRDELDAVFLDGDAVVVVEVKTRSTAMMGDGLAAVTGRKMRSLRRGVARWLRETGRDYDHVRFDVVDVRPVGGELTLEWFRGVA